ncbi:hypothetical protein LR48_Vigan04g173600 [Vigna angularis]|uniref:Uncharacterized protein n=1 Tax=Phaseolus angularis TaxID=3914 RepID=A0A0L9UFN5_PHAAN|nr:hypothetical protein LR48_Vigan04g173600 [Vigna angularis]
MTNAAMPPSALQATPLLAPPPLVIATTWTNEVADTVNDALLQKSPPRPSQSRRSSSLAKTAVADHYLSLLSRRAFFHRTNHRDDHQAWPKILPPSFTTVQPFLFFLLCVTKEFNYFYSKPKICQRLLFSSFFWCFSTLVGFECGGGYMRMMEIGVMNEVDESICDDVAESKNE